MAEKDTNDTKKTKSSTKKTTTVKVETKKEEEQTKTITGLEEKYEVILVYLVSILGFIFSLMKDNKVSKNMKFNYNQAGTIWIVSIVCSFATNFGGYFMAPIRWVSYPITAVLLIFKIIALAKAYNGERYEIPVIADISKSIWGGED